MNEAAVNAAVATEITRRLDLMLQLLVMGVPLALAGIVLAVVSGMMIARWWRLRNRFKPGHCARCGAAQTAEEREHYGRSCERCEDHWMRSPF